MRFLLISLFILFCCYSCCSFFGSYDLGNGFVLLDGDRIEDRIVVFCTPKENKCCNSGSYVIPKSYAEHMLNGKYEEYVKRALSNDYWIIAETYKISTKENRFWIIRARNLNDKSSYEKVKPKVYGPYNYDKFLEKKLSLGIDLKFDFDAD